MRLSLKQVKYTDYARVGASYGQVIGNCHPTVLGFRHQARILA